MTHFLYTVRNILQLNPFPILSWLHTGKKKLQFYGKDSLVISIIFALIGLVNPLCGMYALVIDVISRSIGWSAASHPLGKNEI